VTGLDRYAPPVQQPNPLASSFHSAQQPLEDYPAFVWGACHIVRRETATGVGAREPSLLAVGAHRRSSDRLALSLFPGCRLPLPHKTTGHYCGSLSPPQVRWPLFPNFGPDLYGKSKKSTHGHQNVKPFGPTFYEPGLKGCAFSRALTGYASERRATPVAAAIRV